MCMQNCFRHQLIVVMLCIGIFLSVSVTMTMSSSSSQTQKLQESLSISLNCSHLNGMIRPFAEVNDGPAPMKNKPSFVDLTTQYREIGITSIRTHDLFGPTDINTIFPDLSADPTLESNYHFESSDALIATMIDAGCQVFYRLGESAGQNHTLKNPPVNFTSWAEVCRHITMHYNEGWNNGFFYNIVYWEVWNEPDISAFWNGTADQYYQLYQITAETLKAHNSSLKIGGPCTSSVSNINFTERFLQYVSDHEVPLDFFSWHCYAGAPSQYYALSCYVRQILDSYGFTETENINSEWNLDLLTPQRNKENALNAAFTACSLTVFQDASLDSAYRYRGNQDDNWLLRFLGLDLSLFTITGVYKRSALTYKAMNYITTDTPLRLLTPAMNASNGITYLAGISEDKTNVSLLLSNFNAPDTSFTLGITDLPWNTNYTMVRYLIDETHHLEIIEETAETASPYVGTQILKSNSVQLYRFTNSSVIPQEGPDVAKIPFLLRLPFLDPLIRVLSIFLILFILG
jgi:xylan 1,4-beta-xylosidase